MVTRRRFLQGVAGVPLLGIVELALAHVESPLPSVAKKSGTALTGAPRAAGYLRWDADRYGNHRYIAYVARPTRAVRVTIPWRRRDRRPEQVETLVVGPDGAAITNVVRIHIDQVEGVFVFEAGKAGVYSFYYQPYITSGNPNYPTVTYREPKDMADAVWLRDSGAGDAHLVPVLPEAELIRYEAVDDFDAYTLMERVASPADMQKLLDSNPKRPWLLFPESREHPIRMFDQLPRHWVERGAGGKLAVAVLRGEYASFQVGLWAARAAAMNVRVSFADLSGPQGSTIQSSRLTCFNLGGISHTGQPFADRLDVSPGRVQPLWMGLDVPADAAPGLYRGALTIDAEGAQPEEVSLEVSIDSAAASAHGDEDPFKFSRLRWLNSTLAQNNDLVEPFTTVTVDGSAIHLFGRRVVLAANGLPGQISSYFDERMTGLGDTPHELLVAPMKLLTEDTSGVHSLTSSGALDIRTEGPGKVRWEVAGQAGSLEAKVNGSLELDGTLEFVIALTATHATRLEDIRLEIPLANDVARYELGLGRVGSPTPLDFEWKWNVEHNQDGAWIGTVNAGLEFHLRDNHYRRPLNTNFYQSQPLVMPTSWDNDGRGGIRFKRERTRYVVVAYSGARVMPAGQTLYYNLVLRVTPFKPINPARHFADRYFQGYGNLDVFRADGVSVVNVHQGTPINPWINYPFLDPGKMKDYVDAAHARDMKVKLYYTIRELSNRAPELPMLESLDGCRARDNERVNGPCSEVINHGEGGGYSWLQEHLNGDYIQGWHTLSNRDSAVVDSGQSRWDNYYVEGLNWLAQNILIDGIYIDDCAFGRTTMKRARKVLDAHRPHALIDLHSANQFDPRDGWISSALLYMELFPYIDRLWFGEEFDYEHTSPAYWLTEVSGIPYGLMGEMLQGGGNPWRGMVFGMTSRMGDPATADPRPLWKLWGAFGIEQADMVGWWVKDTPVTTNDSNVLATSYVHQGSKTLIALASWAQAKVNVQLRIDWKALGLDPGRARLLAPAIERFQAAASFGPGDAIPVEPRKGWLLILE